MEKCTGKTYTENCEFCDAIKTCICIITKFIHRNENISERIKILKMKVLNVVIEILVLIEVHAVYFAIVKNLQLCSINQM